VILLTGLHATTFLITEGREDLLTGTRKANVEMAYNLHYHAVFSESWEEPRARAFSAYRPPAYPTFLALGMFLVGDLDTWDLGRITMDASRALSPLYAIQKSILLLTAYLAMYAVWRTTRSHWLCLLPFPLICHTPLFLIEHRSILNKYTNLFYPTPFATLLITALGLSLLIAFERKRYWQFALSGCLAGVLALTRAAFLYYIFLGALLLIVWLWRRPDQRRVLAPRAACGIVVALMIAFAWMARNQHHFGRFFIAERGGYQLAVRAQMLEMDTSLYFVSFLYWSNSRFLKNTVLPRMLDDELRERIDRQLNHKSWKGYKTNAKREWLRYQRQYDSSVVADRILLRESAAAILKRPIKHLLISVPLFHRGMCVEKPYLLNWLFFSCFFGLAGWALLRGRSGLLAMLSPALFCFGFNTAVINNLSRYNVLLIPILCVATAIALHHGTGIVARGKLGCMGRRYRPTDTSCSSRERLSTPGSISSKSPRRPPLR
jgi:hypothetical protein